MKVFAPAKINLGLSVTGRVPPTEPHAGYHTLHTLMVPLDVGDELEVTAAAALDLTVTGADLPTDARNLVYRAAAAYLQAAGAPGGASIVLHKRLPLAAGLGGGSSDAAGTLLALAQLYPSGVDLPALALKLGADVPFFLRPGPALVQGIGEMITPLALPPVWAVLYNPGVEVSAADAYRWLAPPYSDPLDVAALQNALTRGHPLPYLNSLQAGVVARHPEVGEALDTLSRAGLHSALMSGSGSTVFALARSRAHAEEAAAALQQAHPGAWVRAAASIGG